MVEKREVFRYTLLVLICVVLISILLVLRGGPTGYAVYSDSGSDFDDGSYVNTTYNGSAVVLVDGNLSGVYTSQIFDAGNDASWNNISWGGSEPNAELLFAVDGGGDVYKSSDLGVTWVLSQEDFGRTTDTQDMFSDSNYLYIISASNKEVWRSIDGAGFIVINNSFTTNGLRVGASNNSILFIATGSGVVYRSYDSGINWEEVGDVNGGKTEDPKGIDINSSNSIFVVDGKGRVELSLDSGVTWIEQTGGYGGGSATDSLGVDRDEDIYILNNKQIYKSTDEGINWNVINNSFTPYSNDGCDMLIDSNDDIFIVDCTGRIFKSNDQGVNWQEIGDFNAAASNDPKGLTNFIQPTNLSFQVKNCSLDDCSDGSWHNVDLDNINLQGRYFQYQVSFTSPSASVSPILESVDINYDLLNTAPSLTITDPQDGASYGYNESLELNFIASDSEDNLESCWYSLNGGGNIAIAGCANTTIDVPEEENVLIVYANDSLGEEVSDSTSFSVQVGAPTIVLYSPIDVYFSSGEDIEFSYTPTDLDLESCELWGDFSGNFGLNQTDSSVTSGSVNSFNLDLEDGNYLWNIRCNDSLGNSAINGNKSFYVDTIEPNLSISEPSGAKTSRTEIPLAFSASDSNLDGCWYNVYQGDSLHVSNTSVNCSVSSITFDVAADGNFVLYFYVNDSASNSNNASSSFSVDTSSTPPPDDGGGGGSSGGGSIASPKTIVEGKLEVSEVGEVIAQKGDKKTLSINVQNIGKIFVNNCRLIAKGDLSSWIYSTQMQGVAPGENIDFIFDLNIPEEIQGGDYSGNLEINCDEASDSQGIIVSIPVGLQLIEIKEVKNEPEGLNIYYTLDSDQIVGASVSVEVWIVNEDGQEVKRVVDSFSVQEGLIERSIVVELPEDLVGIYSVYFALSSDLESFVKQSVVLGKSSTTGFAVLGGTRGKIIGYVIFIGVIVAGIFFILRKHGKNVKGHKKNNKWLLRKRS